MSNITLEIRQMADGFVIPGTNVIFDTPSPHSPEIDYDDSTGIITFNEAGVYSVKWWIATETTLIGAIGFELISSQGDAIPGWSPLVTGQISGFGAVDIIEAGTTLSLVNRSQNNVVFSRRTQTKAYLLVTSIENAGSTGIGTIIPFSAGGHQNVLMSNENGERWMISMLGFGNSGEYVAPNDPIEFFTEPGDASYYAFSMPTAGTLTSLSVSFILDQVGTEAENNVTAQLYYSLTFDNTFMPVPGAAVNLGTVSSDDPYGKVFNGIVTGIDFPVPAQTNLLLVFYNTTNARVSSLMRGVMQGGLLIT